MRTHTHHVIFATLLLLLTCFSEGSSANSLRQLGKPRCGDDKRQGSEECDGTDEDTDCPSLICSADCKCPGVSSTDTPTKAPTPTTTTPSQKRGLIIGGQAVNASAEHFNDHVSWFYNYKQHPLGWQTSWAVQNGIEFVPMFSKDWLNNPDGSIRCRFDDTTSPCSTDDAIAVITETLSVSGLKVEYLMGFNEMYNNPPPVDMTPLEAAQHWTQYVQPAGVYHNLKLVSPTLNAKPNAVSWFSDFLRACRNTITECDINLIDVFAIHQYDCRESLWRNRYGPDQSLLFRELKANLGNSWGNYLKSRPLWVTETNCYWEVLEIGDRYPHPDSKGQCERTAGKLELSHGQGSIATMEELSTVERYSWWTLWNPQIKPNMLTYKEGQLTPAGRAYLNPGDTSVDCEYPGTKIYAESAASLDGGAELSICETTGTQMIKGLGNGGSANFTNVYVASSGSHAMNVAFVTAVERDLSVSVNGEPAVQFPFVPSGDWCVNGGKSTVLPIELDGFVAGDVNTIAFGGSASNEPIVEWFSIVDSLI